jgi:hypothetical protein
MVIPFSLPRAVQISSAAWKSLVAAAVFPTLVAMMANWFWAQASVARSPTSLAAYQAFLSRFRHCPQRPAVAR